MARRSKVKQVYQKLDHDYVRSLGVAKKPTLDYSWRRGAEVMKLPSLNAAVTAQPTRESIMDPRSLAKESVETQQAIVAKSKRIAVAFNKGAYQYISDDTDVKQLSRKTPI